MPAKSPAQQKAAGAALSAKRGETPKSKLKGASKSMASSMSEKELEKMASTKRKGKARAREQEELARSAPATRRLLPAANFRLLLLRGIERFASHA